MDSRADPEENSEEAATPTWATVRLLWSGGITVELMRSGPFEVYSQWRCEDVKTCWMWAERKKRVKANSRAF